MGVVFQFFDKDMRQLSDKTTDICFGFFQGGYSADFRAKVAYIKYFPYTVLARATANSYLRLLRKAGIEEIVDFPKRSSYTSICKTGVSVDLTKHSVPIAVGALELIRNACNHPRFIDNVMATYAHKFHPLVALYMPRVGYIECPYADTTAPFSAKYDIGNISIFRNAKQNKDKYGLWKDRNDYRGVFDVYSGDSIRKIGNIKHSVNGIREVEAELMKRKLL